MTTVHRSSTRPGATPGAAPVQASASAPAVPQALPESGVEPSPSPPPSPLGIVHLASEMAPLVKVGGLADVLGALSQEQARRGHRVVVTLPAYRDLELPAGVTTRSLGSADVTWGLGSEPAEFELVTPPGGRGARILLLRHIGPRAFFDRPGIYDDPRTGEGYADNSERFLFFCRAALEALARLGEPIDVLHAHDHQAAWAPCFARTHAPYVQLVGSSATVFTIHNLGYQGITDSWVLGLAGFGPDVFYPGGPFEYWGRVNSMKVGLAFADMLSTVSPRYAREIQSSGEFGFGLEGVLQRRSADLRGILNGIDDQYWNPAIDPYLPRNYDVSTLERKADNRAALAAECGFPGQKDWPLIGMVTRLVEQKGLDLIDRAQHELMRLEARWVVLGDGQPRYVEMMKRLAANFPERFYYRGGFDEPLAHRIEGGCDLFLMPSRYEPCGLNQLYSLRYGTPPVVRAVGGLADSVQEFDPLTRQGTGFAFSAFEPGEMVGALRHALAICRQPELWRVLQRNGMSMDFSWRRSADGYDRLYAEALQRVRSGRVQTLDSVRGRI